MSSVVPIRRNHLSTGIDPEKARAEGYTCLSPLERAVAIEFATTGHTVRQVAKDLGQPLGEVRRAFGSPIVRALIHDLHEEIAKHKIINAAWVEQQVMAVWPQLIGEEEVNLVDAKTGEQYSGKKFHASEVASLIRHFSGNKDQTNAGGVQVMINFGDMGVDERPPIESVTVKGPDTDGD